jgi:hypothetical protein
MTSIATLSPLSPKTAVLFPTKTEKSPLYSPYRHLFCPLDLTPSQFESYHTDNSFEDLKQANYTNKEPLSILRTARANLEDKALLTVYDLADHSNPIKSIESLCICGGFELVNHWDQHYFLRKRPIIKKSIPFRQRNLVIKEAETPQEIEMYLEFLLYCYPVGQNYDPDIDRMFSNHSFTLLAYMEDKPEEIIGVGRYTHFLEEYGYYLPLQLATLLQEAQDTGKHFVLPKDLTSMGEILALSKKTKEGSQAYLKILHEIMTYQHQIAKTHLTYTTYPQRDQSIGDRAKKRFGFKQVFHNNSPICLKYGTFADHWGLLALDALQIAYNCL